MQDNIITEREFVRKLADQHSAVWLLMIFLNTKNEAFGSPLGHFPLTR
jgi:hypothetical protein